MRTVIRKVMRLAIVALILGGGQLAKARGDLANANAALRNAEITMARNDRLFAEHVISAKNATTRARGARQRPRRGDGRQG